MTATRPRPAALWLWLVLVGGLLVLMAAVVLLGLTWLFVAIPLLALAACTAWLFRKLRVERSEHAAALAEWNASEAVLAERLRLARDLHDIVSHGLGMITVRAAAATHLHRRTPNEQALLAALVDVEDISRTATVELRRMLEALRETDEQPSRHPLETLASLPDIIGSARRAGLQVDLHQDELGFLSPGAQVAICSVVREGLANCARHAGSTHVEVRLQRNSEAVTVTIDDDGPARGWAVRPGAGHGLTGLRERLAALGGALVAGPRPSPNMDGAGFSLAATIPEAAS